MLCQYFPPSLTASLAWFLQKCTWKFLLLYPHWCVPPIDFCSKLILPSSLDSRSILFGKAHCCTLTLGILDSVGPMASFVTSVASPSKWSWSGELWSELLPQISAGLEINGIKFSVYSIETKCGKAAKHAFPRLACAAVIRCFIDVYGVTMS